MASTITFHGGGELTVAAEIDDLIATLQAGTPENWREVELLDGRKAFVRQGAMAYVVAADEGVQADAGRL